MAESGKKTGGNRKTLKGLRADCGMKQSELARRLGVSIYTVSAWERGIQKPSWEHLSVLAALLNTSAADLVCILGIGGDDDETGGFLHCQDTHLTARGQVGIVSEILYLFTLLDEQGKNTVRTALEIPEEGADGRDHAERA